jgi:hypothetical protein
VQTCRKHTCIEKEREEAEANGKSKMERKREKGYEGE